MAARRKTTTTTLPHGDSIEVRGKTLTRGDEFTVKGEGRFAFRNVYLPDGSVTAYGVTDKSGGGARSFMPDQITTIHRTNRKET